MLENSADTPRHRKRLTIYNKEQELKLVGNKDFLNLLSNRKVLLNYFKSKIRFEFNINTKTQIRTFLKISTNSLNAENGAYPPTQNGLIHPQLLLKWP